MYRRLRSIETSMETIQYTCHEPLFLPSSFSIPANSDFFYLRSKPTTMVTNNHFQTWQGCERAQAGGTQPAKLTKQWKGIKNGTRWREMQRKGGKKRREPRSPTRQGHLLGRMKLKQNNLFAFSLFCAFSSVTPPTNPSRLISQTWNPIHNPTIANLRFRVAPSHLQWVPAGNSFIFPWTLGTIIRLILRHRVKIYMGK